MLLHLDPRKFQKFFVGLDALGQEFTVLEQRVGRDRSGDILRLLSAGDMNNLQRHAVRSRGFFHARHPVVSKRALVGIIEDKAALRHRGVLGTGLEFRRRCILRKRQVHQIDPAFRRVGNGKSLICQILRVGEELPLSPPGRENAQPLSSLLLCGPDALSQQIIGISVPFQRAGDPQAVNIKIPVRLNRDPRVFCRSTERGKCFIEYIPAECAWNPIEAPGYMYINCLWVSGSFKGHGYSSDLLSECIEDSKEKGKKGLCILAAARKKPFLADSKFLKYKGFKACDEADNGIQLWYLPFEEKTEPPVFKECAKHHHINESGYVLYYTNQCPFNAKYVPILEETAQKNGIPLKAVKIENRKDAQNVPTPITTYALFCDGEYVTNEQMNDKKFLKLVGR